MGVSWVSWGEKTKVVFDVGAGGACGGAFAHNLGLTFNADDQATRTISS